jgi:hypothetical protein
MEWVKLATDFYDDPAVVAAGDDAELLFVRGLAYCGGVENTGILPSNICKRLCPTRTAQRIEKLLAHGLWIEVPGGYQIAKWGDWQSELDALAARRRADRERKRAQRDRDAAARAESLSKVVTGQSRDEAPMSQQMSRDRHVTVTPLSALEKGEKELPTNQSAWTSPIPVPRAEAVGGSEVSRETNPNLDAAVALLAALPSSLRPGRKAVGQLAPAVAELLRLGWPPEELTARMATNAPTSVGNPGGFLSARLPAAAPYGHAADTDATEPAVPPWCTKCDERTRLRETDDDRLARCPDCNPLEVRR